MKGKNTMKTYRCLLNEDMGCIGTVQTPACMDYDAPITRAQVEYFVQDVSGTAVDAFLCCPTALRQPLWRSRVLPYWDTPASYWPLPPRQERTSSEAALWRIRDYIHAGGDPVRETYEAVKAAGMDFFFSYRMNDWHYVEFITPEAAHRYPTVDEFYKANLNYRIGSRNAGNPVGWEVKNPYQQNYLIPAVREHYYALLEELVSDYDIDGLELDFMRSPNYFPEEQLAEGTVVMTAFVRRVRELLDVYGARRQKVIPLCLHMPHRYAYCAAIGFDLETMAREGLIDMVNVTSSYFQSTVLEIEEFKTHLPGVAVYGDIQAIISNYPQGNGVAERRMTREMYETAAHSLLSRGADGVALFNYQFLRPIDQPGSTDTQMKREEEESLLLHLADRAYLKRCPKHYILSGYQDLTWDGSLPAWGRASVCLRVEDTDPIAHPRAVLRVVCRSGCTRDAVLTATFNGVVLEETGEREELFPVSLTDGLYPPDSTRNYTVPVELLQPENRVCIDGGAAGGQIEIFGLELALYNA